MLLTTLCPCIGHPEEAVQVFVARKLDYPDTEIDHAELVESSSLPLAGAIATISNGTNVDTRTVSALFLAEQCPPLLRALMRMPPDSFQFERDGRKEKRCGRMGGGKGARSG